jgi:hypothetical protein
MNNLKGLIEVSFESIKDDKINDFMHEVFKACIIDEIDHSDLGEIDLDKFDGNFLNLFSNGADSTVVFVRTPNFNVGEAAISDVCVQIIKCLDVFSILLIFSFDDISVSHLEAFPEILMQYSVCLANKYEISDFFCGYEPAWDENTRLFTRDMLGPWELSNIE